jgi:hypothetical protein
MPVAWETVLAITAPVPTVPISPIPLAPERFVTIQHVTPVGEPLRHRLPVRPFD